MPTGPLTIAQMVVGQNDEVALGITDVFAREVHLSDTLPFHSTDGGMEYKYSRPNPDSQPTPSYRVINGTFSSSSSNKEELTETWEPLGQFIDIDILIRDNKALNESPETRQLKDATDQLAREFNDAVLNADNRVVFGTDSSGNKLFRPAGVRQRCQNASQFKNDTGIFIDAAQGGSAPDLRRGVASTADIEKTISLWMDITNWLKPTHMMLNWYYIGTVSSMIRTSKYFDVNKDMFDRQIFTFNGCQMVDPGYKTAVRNSRDLTNTTSWVLGWENASGVVQTSDPGAGSRYGSVFFMRVGDRAFHGVQPHAFRTDGPLKLQNMTQLRWKIEWAYGFATEGYRDVAEFYDAKLA